MIKAICLIAITAAALTILSCSEKKTKAALYAPKKIMTVTEATAFIKASTDTEGMEIIITAQSLGVLPSSGNTISLSLADDIEETEKNHSNNFNACFRKEAAEYARAVPNKATVTISGRVKLRNGQVQLEDCKLIAQN
jgi:TctA family transporter